MVIALGAALSIGLANARCCTDREILDTRNCINAVDFGNPTITNCATATTVYDCMPNVDCTPAGFRDVNTGRGLQEEFNKIKNCNLILRCKKPNYEAEITCEVAQRLQEGKGWWRKNEGF